MVKNFVLDTNVLVHDPDCFEKFEDNNIIIPFPVLEEIDKLKSKQ
ncbi:MAG: PIN domain-containing protein, partial [Petrotogales bacterium]